MPIEGADRPSDVNPPLAAALKSIINNKTYTKWNGKLYSSMPPILKNITDTIKAAWAARSLRPETVKTAKLLNEVARDISIIKSLKNTDLNLDPKMSKVIINETLIKINELIAKLPTAVPNIQIWIDGSKSQLIHFSEELKGIQKELIFRTNLVDIPQFDKSSSPRDDVIRFRNELFVQLQKDPIKITREDLKINNLALDQILVNLPSPKIKFEELAREKDPVQKLLKFNHYVTHDLLIKGYIMESPGEDDVMTVLESLFRLYPAEASAFLTDIVSIDQNQLQQEYQKAKAENPRNLDLILATEHRFMSLYGLANYFLTKPEVVPRPAVPPQLNQTVNGHVQYIVQNLEERILSVELEIGSLEWRMKLKNPPPNTQLEINNLKGYLLQLNKNLKEFRDTEKDATAKFELALDYYRDQITWLEILGGDRPDEVEKKAEYIQRLKDLEAALPK